MLTTMPRRLRCVRLRSCRKNRWHLHEPYDSSDFDYGKDKLCFTVAFDSKEVDDGNHEEEDGDKDGLAETVVPVFDCKGTSNNL